jgi:hypothetical protein
MTNEHSPICRQSQGPLPVSEKRRVMVVCAHLRPGRVKRRSSYVMQPISGLHVASLIDAQRYDVSLWHEDWHGPYDTTSTKSYDIVFLSGLQADFDRMRQLSFHFGAAAASSSRVAASVRFFRNSPPGSSMSCVRAVSTARAT